MCPGEKSNFSVFGIGGTSFIDFGQDREENRFSYDTPKGYRTRYGSDMGAVGASYTYFTDENTRIETKAAISGQRVTTTIDSLYENGEDKLFFHENNSEWKTSFHSKLISKIDA